MLWPDGPSGTLRPPGAFLETPLDEGVVSFCVSRHTFFVIAVSATVVGLYRLKPLAPLFLRQQSPQETEEYGNYTRVVASYTGSHVALVRCGPGRTQVLVHSVVPKEDLVEVLHTRTSLRPGPGEALGARELRLEGSRVLDVSEPVVGLCGLESTLVVVGPTSLLLISWETDEQAIIKLDSIGVPATCSTTVVAASHATLLGRLALTLSSGAVYVVKLGEHLSAELICVPEKGSGYFGDAHEAGMVPVNGRTHSNGGQAASPATSRANGVANEGTTEDGGLDSAGDGELNSALGGADGQVIVQDGALDVPQDSGLSNALEDTRAVVPATAFNLRLAKLAVVYQGELRLHTIKDTHENPLKVPLPSESDITCLSWSTNGSVLVVGQKGGYLLVSALGMILYTVRTHEPVMAAEWSISSDWLFLLLGNQLCYVPMTRLVSQFPQGAQFPVLASSDRLMIYNDAQCTELPTDPWLIVPLPPSYPATSWPIMFASTSHDGHFVAVGGSLGVICFSTVTRHWIDFADAEFVIRGGLCWHGDHLIIAATTLTGQHMIRVYHCVDNSNHEAQVVDTRTLPGTTMALDVRDTKLTAVANNGSLYMFDLENGHLDLYKEMTLSSVLVAPGRVRSLSYITDSKFIFLIDDRLVSITHDEKSHKFKRSTMETGVEFYYLNNDQSIWSFDGHVAVLLRGIEKEKLAEVAVVELDAYPVAIDTCKGILTLVEPETAKSFDDSFQYTILSTSFKGYLPSVLEAELGTTECLETAKKYKNLDYFDQILESLLHHVLVEEPKESRALTLAFGLVRNFESWPRVVAGCARKTETKYWGRLFAAVGEQPQSLFSQSLANGCLKTASEYLMVLQAQGSAQPGGTETVQLFNAALREQELDICKQVCQFLYSIDSTGETLRAFEKRTEL